MTQSLLAEMQPGLLGSHIKPLKARLRAVIESGHHPAGDVESRVKLINVAARPVKDKHFEVVAAALLSRQRLQLGYYSRVRDDVSALRLASLIPGRDSTDMAGLPQPDLAHSPF